uniref:Uncharacterized protein n=1 Tax=Tanacetum cinerariifolium TaxID=118510 RepID=A0A6L2KXN8_TANCI|nr:hypothetical protein [Tanacetum cinerariifolium]
MPSYTTSQYLLKKFRGSRDEWALQQLCFRIHRVQAYTSQGDGAQASTWKTFGGNTCDLGSILEETGQEYNFTQKKA